MDTPQYPPPLNQQPIGNYGQNPIGFLINSLVGNMKFVGVFTIIYGALTCLGCISAAIGIPMIFAGIRLRESADFFKAYADANMNNPEILSQALEKQNRFFNIQKIIIIVSLVLTVLYIIFMILVFFGVFGELDFLNRSSQRSNYY